MSSVSDAGTTTTPENRIRTVFQEVFVPVALRGLPRMLVDDGRWFSFRSFAGEGGQELRNEGRSERYSAMALIGLERQRAHGRRDAVPTDAVVESLADWAPDAPNLGDAALVLWILAMRGDARAAALATRIVTRQTELSRPEFGFASMDMGCLLTGLSEALRQDVEVDGQRALAADVARRLREQQDPGTGLLSFARKVRRKNFLRVRLDTRLGSFASQVYPTMGFAAHARATGDLASAAAARACAERICALQGDAGQWWWVYDVQKGHAAVRYPVYSVHQDAMGPMMLCAAALGSGDRAEYHRAIAKSLTWFEQRPELSERNLVDTDRGAVWRAVQHDDPHTTRRLGLGPGELKRMSWVAWFGAPDRRLLSAVDGHVCAECRSYHLGWILLADAMFEEVLAER